MLNYTSKITLFPRIFAMLIPHTHNPHFHLTALFRRGERTVRMNHRQSGF